VRNAKSGGVLLESRKTVVGNALGYINIVPLGYTHAPTHAPYTNTKTHSRDSFEVKTEKYIACGTEKGLSFSPLLSSYTHLGRQDESVKFSESNRARERGEGGGQKFEILFCLSLDRISTYRIVVLFIGPRSGAGAAAAGTIPIIL